MNDNNNLNNDTSLNVLDDSKINCSSELDNSLSINFGKKRFPFAIVIIFIIFVTLLVLYYYLWITPSRVLNKSFDSFFSNISNILYSIENSEHDNVSFHIETQLTTSGDDTINDPNIAFLNGLKANLDTKINLSNLDLGFNLYYG